MKAALAALCLWQQAINAFDEGEGGGLDMVCVRLHGYEVSEQQGRVDGRAGCFLCLSRVVVRCVACFDGFQDEGLMSSVRCSYLEAVYCCRIFSHLSFSRHPLMNVFSRDC